ncbi:MAG TPA: cytochrome c oxidase subunit 3, partial [Flavobacteriales bacterium]|nr:cytochrome c oxidase subunit 3 [Flavobacteriales bacterium]
KFVPTGKYGSDFTVTWRGEHLKFENGIFYKSTGPLNEQENLKLKWTRNTASSFVYILTFLHLLHMIGGILYVLFVTIYAFQLRFDSSNYLKIKLANIYWHFLGLLWIYLFVFLQYIH